MYYAIFPEIPNSDVAEFKTEQERDEWVNFQDEFSIATDTTKENCFFKRSVLTDKNIIDSVVNNSKIRTMQDECLPHIKWYLRYQYKIHKFF